MNVLLTEVMQTTNGSKYEEFGGQLLGGMGHARMLLYLINPYETTFEKYTDVPDYLHQVKKCLCFYILKLELS